MCVVPPDMDLTSPAKTQSRTASFTTATVEDELIPSLWQQLPTDLLVKVLTKLPLSALRKFSRVSKRWKAWFRSVEFARGCESVEWTFFHVYVIERIFYMLLPNLKTNSWDKHPLHFLQRGEYIPDFRVAVDRGLLCYKIRKKRWGFDIDASITLVAQNPLTRKSRRLIVPYQLEYDLPPHKMVWGLMMDKEYGSYKVVVAFCDQNLPRNAFIYDSVSNSWSSSAALTPVLVPHFEEDRWQQRSVVCSGGELLWVIEEYEGNLSTDGLIYKWLIKYDFELDTWSMVTQESPVLGEGEVYLVHHDLTTKIVGIEDIERLVNEAGDTGLPANFNPKKVAFGGGTWYIVSGWVGPRQGLDLFAISVKPHTVTRLPKVHDRVIFCQENKA
ncbi:hypothetical protein R1sor_003556 [Riccia sorocarpa]|uniref:F-box domain-containing protein n=1 Tax=Riccia sorocarpa TaxID=122646 RepID=A0ABD3H834_9MARC